MKCLIWGKFTFNHIYFLFYLVFRTASYVLKRFLKGNEAAKEFFIVYSRLISRLFSVIPFFIYKKLSKTKKEEKMSEVKTKQENEINYIYNDKSKKLRKKLVKSTFIVAAIEFLAESILCIFYFFNDKPSALTYQLEILMIFNTVTQYFASYFILKYQFYKHHYLSFGINFTCLIIKKNYILF